MSTAVIEQDARVLELFQIASRLRCLRVREVVTRAPHHCVVCGVPMSPGSPMVVQVLQCKRYTTSWYFCLFCPAPDPRLDAEMVRS